MKRCGKSAPLAQQCTRQGKPHTEQDQIGKEFGWQHLNAFRLEALELPGRSLEPSSNGRPRGITVSGGNAVTEFGLQVQHHLWPLLSETKAGAFN